MKRPFPRPRPDTITGANVTRALADHQQMTTPEQVADYFCGGCWADRLYVTHAKPRHVARAARLMGLKTRAAS